MTDFAIWTPKFDGDAPPNWHYSMPWSAEPHVKPFPTSMQPLWSAKVEYHVPDEALATPFDVEAYLALGRANADKLPTGVAEALGPERDWAEAVFRDAYAAWDPLKGNIDAAADLIRTRCRPIGNDTVTDEWLADAVARISATWDTRWEIAMKNPKTRGQKESFEAAVRTLRAIIAEATQ